MELPSPATTIADSLRPQIEQAAAFLRAGKLVAFPTETVYGLGANAENDAAVRLIFTAKGRPADHPVIVHLAHAQQIEDWAVDIPATAWQLAAAFWPGPLTLILSRSPRVLDVVTGGQNTVGLRVPSHPVAHELLKLFGGGIAAPSANRFGRLSPTLAAHVRQELGDSVELILDGGASEVGLESTIVDLTGPEPVLLRPGAITAEQIAAVLNQPLGDAAANETRTSGRLQSHYAPRAKVIVVEPLALPATIRAAEAAKERVAVVCDEAYVRPANLNRAHWFKLPADPVTRAQRLYIALRAADDAGYPTLIVVHERDAENRDAAIWDRLQKAAAPRT
ncbi:Threonylcarbamoyl-AMP synthase [Anatilimnocola aggregata]|uniref:Threonylcarbamoyl-AMP synthase n=1 Tax=Anatilimnocola aggregata TaxID=2528021 RepID=A0A517YJF0_9BACT|nr:L-threonylcarbamoyladenylate synthase [Anatilimnocola aggregata]QDU30349.1 Threonylcarbamoyl-AMP synthase [Anatilimnocola aggregata]